MKTKSNKKIVRALIIVTTLLLMIGGVMCQDIFKVGTEISKDLFDRIKDFYCNGLFYVLGVIDLVFLAIYAKDEKKSAIFKTALFWIIGVFVALHLFGTLKDTVKGIVSKYDTESVESTEFGGNVETTTGTEE